jgi:hypothetical protein
MLVLRSVPWVENLQGFDGVVYRRTGVDMIHGVAKVQRSAARIVSYILMHASNGSCCGRVHEATHVSGESLHSTQMRSNRPTYFVLVVRPHPHSRHDMQIILGLSNLSAGLTVNEMMRNKIIEGVQDQWETCATSENNNSSYDHILQPANAGKTLALDHE